MKPETENKKNLYTILNIFALCLLLLSVLPSPARAAEGERVFKGRAFSLKVAQERAEKCKQDWSCSPELEYLAYLASLHGYLVDDEADDLILYGEVDRTFPPLRLDDLVVALRNAWLVYAPRKDGGYVYQAPGCSIDPTGETLVKLKNIADSILSGGNDQMAMDRVTLSWKNTCSAAQNVTVAGVPFDSHFAKTIVEADYYMKRIVDGTSELHTEGLDSLVDMTLDIIDRDIEGGRRISVPLRTMNRFWFTAGNYEFAAGVDTTFVKHFPIELLTEEEFMGEGGERTQGTGRVNPVARKFADAFDSLYDRISLEAHIFFELEALFREMAIARLMKYNDGKHKSLERLDYLIRRYPVRREETRRTVPGTGGIRDYRKDVLVEGGREAEFLLWLPSCGGVSMDIEITPQVMDKSPETVEALKKMKGRILGARPSADALYWDFELRESLLPGR